MRIGRLLLRFEAFQTGLQCVDGRSVHPNELAGLLGWIIRSRSDAHAFKV